jgi:hypothetical protein
LPKNGPKTGLRGSLRCQQARGNTPFCPADSKRGRLQPPSGRKTSSGVSLDPVSPTKPEARSTSASQTTSESSMPLTSSSCGSFFSQYSLELPHRRTRRFNACFFERESQPIARLDAKQRRLLFKRFRQCVKCRSGHRSDLRAWRRVRVDRSCSQVDVDCQQTSCQMTYVCDDNRASTHAHPFGIEVHADNTAGVCN